MKKLILPGPKLKFLYSLVFFYLALFTLYRLGFFFYFKNYMNPETGWSILNQFFLGFRFDARCTMILVAPALVLVNLPLNPAFKMKFLGIFYSVIAALIHFVYIVDAGFFSYLKTRVNSTIIQFFKNPLISLDMVLESYPWFWLCLLFAILTVITSWLIFTKIITKLSNPTELKTNQKSWPGALLFLFLTIWGIYGSIKMYPLRWSEAFAIPDTFASNMALNPILYIADTYQFKTTEYDKEKVLEYYDEVATFLGVTEPNKNNLNFVRSYPGNPERASQKPNIVVIVMESMAYFKSSVGGSAVNPTPALEKIASESLLFDRFYTPTIATARSIFAAVTSLPDTSKVKTSSRNPFVVNQHTIMGEFKGYDKFYFLGGSANWGNIRGVFTYNIPGLKIFEEGSYRSPRVDVWGISDLNLFKESKEALVKNYNETKKPFFAFIQSAGFHRPYTIPADSDDFKILTAKDVSPTEIQKYGFDSLEEYNAMRLQDYSLGRFMEMAKKEPWYENTIFFIFGDHALPHNNAANVPEWKKSQANNYHVPLVIHSPKYILPGRENKIASELDVMPTAAGLAGIPYKTRGLGRDLLNPAYDSYRAAFAYNWTAPFQINLIDSEHAFEFISYSQSGKLAHYSQDPSGANVKEQQPEKYQQMERLAKGLFETARYLLHHNPRMD
jgi:phosphoglycerol transferase MdoB-like AlkP superfamily enzyme